MTSLRHLLLIPTTLLAIAGPAAAQDQAPTGTVPVGPVTPPVYRCGTKYTDVACTGGQQVNGRRVAKTFDTRTPPPQDRARQMARAMLPAETREKCNALESSIRREESRL